MSRVFLRVFLPCALWIVTSAAPVASKQFIETFATTAYKDYVNTTALWDTSAGELKLPPFAISLIGTCDTPGTAAKVVVSGDLCFVADQGEGLQILNITDLANPTLTGTYNTAGIANDVVVDGDFAFVADGSRGLEIINITNPASPGFVGNYNTSGTSYGVAVRGNLALVADGTAGLQVINIIDPTNPTLVATYNTPGTARGVAVDGDYVFVADDSFGLRIISISNPLSPVLVGSYDTPGLALGVAVDGDYVLVADGASGLQIINIANPGSPSLAGAFASPGAAYSVVVTGDLAYVADDASGLQVVDLTNPASPTLARSFDTPGLAYGVAVAGGHAFVADYTLGLQIIQTAKPLRSELMRGFYLALPEVGTGVALAGNLALLTAGASTGLQIMDVTDPTMPAPMGSYNTSGEAYDVVVAGNRAFVADGSTGLQIINITNPASPTLTGSFNTPGTAYGVAVAGELAFIADGTSGLRIVNILNPASPLLAGSYDTPGTARDVVLAGDLAFVADFDGGLLVIDITQPATPSLVGTYSWGNVCNVAVDGDLAFVTDESSEVRILNISNPASPTLISAFGVDYGPIGDVQVAGDLLLVLTDWSTMLVDITTPASPLLIYASENIYGTGYAAVIAGPLIYMAASNWAGGGLGGLNVQQVFQSECMEEVVAGQSLSIGGSEGEILRVRLLPTQTAGVFWWVSADGGASWRDLPPDNTWRYGTFGGSDLRWRAEQKWASGLLPAASEVQIEWLYKSASFKAISDVKADQGGRVYVEWERSGYDFTSGTPVLATGYNLYRRVDNVLLAEKVSSDGFANEGEELLTPDGHAAWALPGLDAVSMDGRTYITGSVAAEGAFAFPPGTWALVGTAFATQSEVYTMEATTAADSSAGGTNNAVFVVTTHTPTPTVWFVSAPDSGYSVDNIAPGVPAAVTAAYSAGGVALDWNDSPEPDFQYFRIYRDTDPGFLPVPGNLIKEVAASTWSDPIANPWGYHYKITALDHAGNESGPGAPTGVSGVQDGGGHARTALLGAVPNPFNPSTKLSFDMATSGYARLKVFDTAGRLVVILVNERLDAGLHEVVWDGRDHAGRISSAGVYFYRLEVQDYVETKRMTLVK